MIRLTINRINKAYHPYCFQGLRRRLHRDMASWDSVRDWDKPPGMPPPSAPPPAATDEDGATAAAAELLCTDPSCACLPRQRPGSGPRAANLPPTKARLQDRLLTLAKDNDAGAIVRSITEHGLDPSVGNVIGQTALHVAAVWNSVEAGKALLEAGAVIDAQNDMGGATPLHMAAARGSLEVCELLLERGADSTLEADDGRLAVDVCEEFPAVKRLLYGDLFARGYSTKVQSSGGGNAEGNGEGPDWLDMVFIAAGAAVLLVAVCTQLGWWPGSGWLLLPHGMGKQLSLWDRIGVAVAVMMLPVLCGIGWLGWLLVDRDEHTAHSSSAPDGAELVAGADSGSPHQLRAEESAGTKAQSMDSIHPSEPLELGDDVCGQPGCLRCYGLAQSPDFDTLSEAPCAPSLDRYTRLRPMLTAARESRRLISPHRAAGQSPTLLYCPGLLAEPWWSVRQEQAGANSLSSTEAQQPQGQAVAMAAYLQQLQMAMGPCTSDIRTEYQSLCVRLTRFSLPGSARRLASEWAASSWLLRVALAISTVAGSPREMRRGRRVPMLVAGMGCTCTTRAWQMRRSAQHAQPPWQPWRPWQRLI
jgi:hypothetical protein